jgi:hypothetical protein
LIKERTLALEKLKQKKSNWLEWAVREKGIKLTLKAGQTPT